MSDDLASRLEIIEGNIRDLSSRVRFGSVDIGSAEGVTIFNPNTGARAIILEPVGNAYFGSDVDDPAKTSLAIFSQDEKYNQEKMGAGDALFGDNSANKANILWDRSSGQLKFRGQTTVELYIDTDGSLVAGGGVVKINSDGVEISDTNTTVGRIRWWYNDSGNLRKLGGVYGDYSGSGQYAYQWLYSFRDVNSPWDYAGLILSVQDDENSLDGRLTMWTDDSISDSIMYITDLRVSIEKGLAVGVYDITLGAGDIRATGDIYTVAHFDYSVYSTIVGFSGTPTVEIWIKRVGNTVTIDYYFNGTSDSTALTFTVPYSAKATVNSFQNPSAYISDSGTVVTEPNRARLPGGSAIVTIYKTRASAVWTASGTKIAMGQLRYETD